MSKDIRRFERFPCSVRCFLVNLFSRFVWRSTLSQKDFAKACGFDSTQFNKYVRGVVVPSAEVFIVIMFFMIDRVGYKQVLEDVLQVYKFQITRYESD